jgi:hypothetical protein
MANLWMDRLGASAAAVGPALFFLYFWSEAVFGPSQPNGGPLRMALGFTLVTAGLLCFGVALLQLNAQIPIEASRAARIGTRLCSLSLALLALGLVLWWPVLFLWTDLGPLAGAPVGLGTLSLLGAWVLIGSRVARERSLPNWVRPLPLALFALFFPLLVITGTTSPWPLAAPVFAAFALGWFVIAYAIWVATASIRTGRAALI